MRPHLDHDQTPQEAREAQLAASGAPDVDGFLFLVAPPVRCWVSPDRQVVMEIEGTIWDADILTMSISMGMEVGTWRQHAVRVQRYLDAAPHLPVEEIALQGSGSANARKYRARQRPDLAALFATDPISRVRVGAAHATTDPDLLAVLARDHVHLVRQEVATNLNTRLSDLTALAGDEHPDVRRTVAVNPACPPELLDVLVMDRRAGVRDAVMRRLNGTLLDRSYTMRLKEWEGRPPTRPADLPYQENPCRPRPSLSSTSTRS